MTNHNPNKKTVEQMAAEHKHRIHQDQLYKQSIITKATQGNTDRYNASLQSAIEDLTGVAEAFKHGRISSDDELEAEVKLFLEEYAVNLFNMLDEKN